MTKVLEGDIDWAEEDIESLFRKGRRLWSKVTNHASVDGRRVPKPIIEEDCVVITVFFTSSRPNDLQSLERRTAISGNLETSRRNWLDVCEVVFRLPSSLTLSIH